MYENIEVQESNFCIGPQTGTCCSVDTSGTEALMNVKNDSGSLIRSYTFYPTGVVELNIEAIKSLVYVGPTGLDTISDGLTFFTLENYEAAYCENCGEEVVVGTDEYDNCPVCGGSGQDYSHYANVVRKWKSNESSQRLELQDTVIKRSDEDYFINSRSLSVENIETSFASNTASGTGVVPVSDSSGIEQHDVVMLGPSNDVDNPGALEYVCVISVAGNDLTVSGIDFVNPTGYEYLSGDPVTVFKDWFLFSDPEQDMSDVTEEGDYLSDYGTLFRLDPTTSGSLIEHDVSGVYKGVDASAWNEVYSALSFVRSNNMLTSDVNHDYSLLKSQTLNNVQPDEVTDIIVYDIDFLGNALYRLQDRTVKRDDDGNKTLYEWGSYNYQKDSVVPYTMSVTVYCHPRSLVLNSDDITLTAIVRDQFNVGLLNKNVYFYKSGDPDSDFDPPTGYGLTDSNGVVTVDFEAGDSYTGMNEITVRADGSSLETGSQYVWDGIYIQSYAEFSEVAGVVFQDKEFSAVGNLHCLASGVENFGRVDSVGQLQSVNQSLRQIIIPFFHDFEDPNYPEVYAFIMQGFDDTPIEQRIQQKGPYEGIKDVDQVLISRHLDDDNNKDTVDLDQFTFVTDAIPEFWSEKNPVNTRIWIRLRPFVTSLNPSTLVFKIREVSYAGDSGWVDITSDGDVTTFDAGGINGVVFNWINTWTFHHNAMVYVHIEIYDTAPVPNLIVLDYWFRVIQDYNKPYIINEDPSREEYNVPIDANIEFDIIDTGTGVDLSTLELFVNHRGVNSFSTTTVSGGYHVSYDPINDFNYEDVIEISVMARDLSDNENLLQDSWRFYCISSVAPWFDRDNYSPGLCNRGVYRYNRDISFQVYGIGNGVDVDSLVVYIGGKRRNLVITPIIYRHG
jgi:hypothetical protein